MNVRVNMLKRIALSGMKEREKLIGAKVRCVSKGDFTGQLETGKEYVISDISAGNYDAFVTLEGLPKLRQSDCARRIVRNTFDVDCFELVEVNGNDKYITNVKEFHAAYEKVREDILVRRGYKKGDKVRLNRVIAMYQLFNGEWVKTCSVKADMIDRIKLYAGKGVFKLEAMV